jgi:glyoxylase-like metal-dependent hydrolase (beta-lactamase superfamily II)
MKEILPNLYRIEIPLPNIPLKSLNSYVIKGRGRNLVVDTGLNNEESLAAMLSGLHGLDVDLKETDFFITHSHADHFGLVPDLITDTSVVYCSSQDAVVFEPVSDIDDFWGSVKSFSILHGFPEGWTREAVETHPGYSYTGPSDRINVSFVQEGDTVSAGDYTFKCIETPGHSKGHICLYEESRKILISGDHILADITPNISLWSPGENPLQDYLGSLDKILDYDIKLVLPGHRGLIKEWRERIIELKSHHSERVSEIIAILEKGENSAYQVASRMTWDMSYKTWGLFPATQKLFATWEALAHLVYLEEKRLIERVAGSGKIAFKLCGR